MAYSTDNPPALVSQRVGATGGAVWVYKSTDAVATVKGAGYITNGDELGMEVGDVVLISDTNTPLASLGIVDAVAAGGAAELT